MQIYERIKSLRKDLDKTQQEFADQIKISRSNLGNIETGKISVTDRVITDICNEFSVSEKWLRFGDEPVFTDANDPYANEIMKLYNTLNDDNKKYLRGYIARLLDEQSMGEQGD